MYNFFLLLQPLYMFSLKLVYFHFPLSNIHCYNFKQLQIKIKKIRKISTKNKFEPLHNTYYIIKTKKRLKIP